MINDIKFVGCVFQVIWMYVCVWVHYVCVCVCVCVCVSVCVCVCVFRYDIRTYRYICIFHIYVGV
jgi:hypothetical protein